MQVVDLESVLQPIPTQNFLEKYFMKAPLPIRSCGHSKSLITLKDVEELLYINYFREGELRVVQRGDAIPLESLLEEDYHSKIKTFNMWEVMRLFDGGATIVLQGMENRSNKLAHFANELSRSFMSTISCNIYITPPHNQGFSAHFDTHDVFVVQVHGDKKWKVSGEAISFPIPGQKYKYEIQQPSLMIETLHESDVLYVPRGFVHEAFTNENLSVHVTVGINPIAIVDLVIEGVSIYSRSAPSLRQHFYQPYSTDIGAALLEQWQHPPPLKEDLERLIVNLVGKRLKQSLTYRSDFTLIDRDVTITKHITVKKGVPFVKELVDNEIVITGPSATVKFPDIIEDEIDLLLSKNGIKLESLSETLENETIIEIALALHRAGLVHID